MRRRQQHLHLIAQAITAFDFRLPTEADDPAAYLRALIAHVEARDFAAAHELRVGRPQTEWTDADVAAFLTRHKDRPRRAAASDSATPATMRRIRPLA